MQIVKKPQGQVTVLSLRDPMIDDALGAFNETIAACVAEGNVQIVLEISGVPFIDSAGLEALLHTVSILEQGGGDLRVAAPNDVCKDILEATRTDSLIQVFDDANSATRSLR